MSRVRMRPRSIASFAGLRSSHPKKSSRRRSGPMSLVIITLLVLLGVGLLLALWLLYIYNGLVVAANRFKNAFAQIDVQLKRRYELIPNLVEAVKRATGRLADDLPREDR